MSSGYQGGWGGQGGGQGGYGQSGGQGGYGQSGYGGQGGYGGSWSSGWSSLLLGSSNNNTLGSPAPGDRGYRRSKFAAMAGSVYRAGATAVTEIRETYVQQRSRELFDSGETTIPSSFPDVEIAVSGNDQLIIFPSYAKHHVKGEYNGPPTHTPGMQPGDIQDHEYWRHNWERENDERAVVDVDVRGWVYTPQRGQLTRKNRILLGLARHLSGVPAPRADGWSADSGGGGSGGGLSTDETLPSRLDQERIAKQAAEIERRGQQEKQVAGRGGYSEAPKDDGDGETIYGQGSGSTSPRSLSPPSPIMPPRTTTAASISSNVSNGTTELSEAELGVANSNLVARIAPFLTTPFVQHPVTVFFYNESRSRSRTVMTNEAGHFILRAALDFVPTHVRVLVNERLSAIQKVRVTPQHGVSVISDIDDTVKRSNILAGTKEIFRNTFVRELVDLRVDGVPEWYQAMHQLGAEFHYCSNSPWQLFPVLATFFATVGLPSGSLHLKQYTGMLQGIFEPVAERKKNTLVRLLADFPQRKFLLVGDSGEADLEVYTELAVQHPGRVLGIFIRDVTTPESVVGSGSLRSEGLLDQRARAEPESPRSGKEWLADSTRSGKADSPRSGKEWLADSTRMRVSRADVTRTLPERPPPKPPRPAGPVMGTLIDFSDEPEEYKTDSSTFQMPTLSMENERPASDEAKPKQPPPRPKKPQALRGKTSSSPDSPLAPPSGLKSPPQIKPSPPDPHERPWKPELPPPLPDNRQRLHHSLQPIQRHLEQNAAAARLHALRHTRSSASLEGSKGPAPPPPPARRRPPPNTFSASDSKLTTRSPEGDDSPVSRMWAPMPASAQASPRRGSRSSTGSMRPSSTAPASPLSRPCTTPVAVPGAASAPVNKKVDLWRQRLLRAEEALVQAEREGRGYVALYTWRGGADVVHEALGIMKAAM